MTQQLRRASGRIDWEAARQRLATAGKSEQVLHDEAARILAERAVRLARVSETEELPGARLEVLVFKRGARRYAIESRFVVEVGKCGRLSRVPKAAKALLGVTNLRGDLLPVFDLAVLGDTGNREPPQTSQLLVFGNDSPDFGVLADTVEEVTWLPMASLSEAHVVGVLPHPEYVRGITGDGCTLIDGEAILRDRSLFAVNGSSG